MTTTNSEMDRPGATAKRARALARVMAHQNFDPKSRSDLREMDPDRHLPLSFWKMIAQFHIQGQEAERRWAIIMKGIATMTTKHVQGGCAQNPRVSLGQALAHGYGSSRPLYIERRLDILLAARGNNFNRMANNMFKMLASKGASFNWEPVADLILSQGVDEKAAETIREEIARDYTQAI